MDELGDGGLKQPVEDGSGSDEHERDREAEHGESGEHFEVCGLIDGVVSVAHSGSPRGGDGGEPKKQGDGEDGSDDSQCPLLPLG